jgi:hypothetical protein
MGKVALFSLISWIAIAQTPTAGLTAIKRICVDKIAGEEAIVAAARELAIAGLFSAKRFTVTEKCDKADAILKGAVLERGEMRVRGEGEATDFGAAAGGASATRSSGRAAFGAIAGGSGESLYSAETRASASVVLRLVDPEGTVVSAYSQDSPGGKVKGAIADAIERAVKQLLREVEKAAAKPAAP